MRRGYDLSFTMGSQVFRLPAATGLGRAHFYLLGQENDTAVGRSGSGIWQTRNAHKSAFRGVTEYISASQSIGWDLTKGHLFRLVLADGSRGTEPMAAQRMTAALQGHLRTAGSLCTPFALEAR